MSFNIAELTQPLSEFFEAPLEGGIGLTAVAQETDLRDLCARPRLGNKRRHKDGQGENDEIPHGAEPYDGCPMSASHMPLITVDTADIGAHTIPFALEAAEQVILQFLDNSTTLKGAQCLYAATGSLVCGRSLVP